MDNDAKRYDDRVDLGNRMRKIRIEKGFHSSEKFCRDNDMSRVLYANWESGKGNITYNNLMKVIDAFGVSVKEFFSDGFEQK